MGKSSRTRDLEVLLPPFPNMVVPHKAYLWTVLSCLEQGLFFEVPNVFCTTSVVGIELPILSVRSGFIGALGHLTNRASLSMSK